MGRGGMASALVEVPAFWAEYQRFRDAFVDILDPVFYTPEWLDGEVWSGRMRLFSCEQSAILVSLKPYPTGVVELHGQLATGKLIEIVSTLIPLAAQWAASHGATSAVIESRPGWSKVMASHGYQLEQVSLRKAL